MARQVPIGVLISGGGTNLQAIIDAIAAETLDAKITIRVEQQSRCFRFGAGAKSRHSHRSLDHKAYPSREAYDQAVVDLLRGRGVELVVLAGFMRLLSPVFIKAYSNRIMNIHPALAAVVSRSPRAKESRSIMACASPAARCISSMKSATRGRSSFKPWCRCFPTTARRRWRRAFSSRNTASIPARFNFTPKAGCMSVGRRVLVDRPGQGRGRECSSNRRWTNEDRPSRFSSFTEAARQRRVCWLIFSRASTSSAFCIPLRPRNFPGLRWRCSFICLPKAISAVRWTALARPLGIKTPFKDHAQLLFDRHVLQSFRAGHRGRRRQPGLLSRQRRRRARKGHAGDDGRTRRCRS